MNTAKRDKIILSVLVIVIIALVMFYVSIKPSRDEIKDLNAKISSAQESIDGLKGKSQLINELKKQLEEVESDVEAAEEGMRDNNLAVYLSDFQDITDAKATNTKILFDAITTSEKGHYSVVQTSISFECEYDDLKFIMSALLENKVHCYDVKITEISRSNSDESGEPVATRVKVDFTADYYSSTTAVIPPPDYDFSSGKYGLSQLFDGVAYVESESNTTEEPENP